MKFRLKHGQEWVEAESPEDFIDENISTNECGSAFLDENGNVYIAEYVLQPVAMLEKSLAKFRTN